TLTGFWAIDEKPTGSKDPYALRRAALGVIRILMENDVRLPLTNAFVAAYDGTLYGEPSSPEELAKRAYQPDLLSFFHDRLKVYLRDAGRRHDIVDAVLTEDADDLLMVVR